MLWLIIGLTLFCFVLVLLLGHQYNDLQAQKDRERVLASWDSQSKVLS